MINKTQLEKLAAEKNTPCVSISLNTHRTFPQNAQDDLVLKNLLKEAEDRVIEEYGKKTTHDLLEKITKASSEIDKNYNLDSLHIFISNDTFEIIKSELPVTTNKVYISEKFALRPIIKEYNRIEEYLILLLSQGGVKLYNAINGSITNEIRNEDFPFSEMLRSVSEPEKLTDSKLLDNIVRDYLHKVDKAIVKIHNLLNLQCIVICTGDNYSRLLQVASKPSIYFGYAPLDYNHSKTDDISKISWEIIKEMQHKRRADAINEMLEAVGKGNVYTDLQEIYTSAIDGNGDLLIIHEEFSQPVLMTGERTFDLITDPTLTNAIDDITSNIVWEVLSKKGRVVFTSQDKIKELGNIVLKARY